MNISGNQFVFPNRVDDPAMQANLDALARWINSQVTNQVVAGSNVTVEAQPVQGGPNKSNGIVTISSSATSGGYASLTGPGKTATPGKLTQAGGFTVNDPHGDGILLETAQTGSTALELATTNSNSEIFVNAGGGGASGVTIYTNGTEGITLQDLGGASGVTIYTNGTEGITLQDAHTTCFLETNNGGSGNMVLGSSSGYVEVDAAGFIVTATSTPLSLLCEGPNLIINNSCVGASQLLIESTGTAPIIIQTADAGIDISATGGALTLTGDTNISCASPKMGFFGATPVTQPAAGSIAGVYAAGVALGLWT